MTNIDVTENNSLMDRVQRLERENRKIRRYGTLTLVAIALLILMGQAGKNRALDADSLVIRDANGREVIELGTNQDNSPVLRMFGGSDNKTASVVLFSTQKGSGLTFFGNGVTMLSSTDGPSLVLANGDGGTSIQAASVHIYDNKNFQTNIGKVSTVDTRTGRTTWSTAASLTMVRNDGKVAWQAP